MKRWRYRLVDVFTDVAFGGNPLAVFPEAEGIDDATQQKIARELNLSETTFVVPTELADHDVRVRIYTPAVELPMAGHPTVGTAFVLALEGRIAGAEGADGTLTVVFEEGVGRVPVEVELEGGRPRRAVMDQPLPEFRPAQASRREVAEAIGLAETDLAADLPVEAVSCGLPMLIVPVASLAAARRASLLADRWREHVAGSWAEQIYLFSREVESAGAAVHARMFGPAVGVLEDPATGSAAGPLGSYLVRHGLAAASRTPSGSARLVVEQGLEMGRPSFLEVEIFGDRAAIERVRVGGSCVVMGEGSLEL